MRAGEGLENGTLRPTCSRRKQINAARTIGSSSILALPPPSRGAHFDIAAMGKASGPLVPAGTSMTRCIQRGNVVRGQ
jgi:hypothetical protein